MARGYIGIAQSVEYLQVAHVLGFLEAEGLNPQMDVFDPNSIYTMGIHWDGPIETFDKLFDNGRVPEDIAGLVSFAYVSQPYAEKLVGPAKKFVITSGYHD